MAILTISDAPCGICKKVFTGEGAYGKLIEHLKVAHPLDLPDYIVQIQDALFRLNQKVDSILDIVQQTAEATQAVSFRLDTAGIPK